MVWLAPGLQVYPSEDVLFEAGLLVPVVQTIHDALGKRNLGGTFTVKFVF